MKSYKKVIVYPVTKTVKYYKSLLELAQVFSEQPMPEFILMFPSILRPSRLLRNLTPHKQIKKNVKLYKN